MPLHLPERSVVVNVDHTAPLNCRAAFRNRRVSGNVNRAVNLIKGFGYASTLGELEVLAIPDLLIRYSKEQHLPNNQ